MPDPLYLDYAASAPVREEVLRAVWPVLTETFANPASVHSAGADARERLEWATATLASITGAREDELVFTSGGTESDNLAIIGRALAEPRGKHLIISAVEHAAVRESAAYLQRHHGFRVTVLPVDHTGTVDLTALEDALRPDTTLISVMAANNEVGTVQPLDTVSELARSAKVPLHTDAVQAPGSLSIGTLFDRTDLLSLSGHKFGATRGSGLLLVKRGVALEPTVVGGGQQRNLRSGTQDVASAVAVAVALGAAEHERTLLGQASAEHRDHFISRVLREIPGAELTGSAEHRLLTHASFVFAGVNGEALLVDLDARGIICSSGSACSAGSQDASPVLLAMGFSEPLAHTAVRFSFAASTTAADLDRAVSVLVEVHASLTR